MQNTWAAWGATAPGPFARAWHKQALVTWTIAVQNVTGSCKPYHKAGFPNDDCRFAAWTAMVKSRLVDIAFLVDAHCSPVDIQRCQAYTCSMGDVATKGAPTTAQTSSRLTDPAEGLPTVNGIQSGGIMMLISPPLHSRVVHTAHWFSGRTIPGSSPSQRRGSHHCRLVWGFGTSTLR